MLISNLSTKSLFSSEKHSKIYLSKKVSNATSSLKNSELLQIAHTNLYHLKMPDSLCLDTYNSSTGLQLSLNT